MTGCGVLDDHEVNVARWIGSLLVWDLRGAG